MRLIQTRLLQSKISKVLGLILGSTLWAISAPGWVSAATGTEIGRAELQIAGTRLLASPASQTVPFDTPTVVHTSLDGYDPGLGILPVSMRVEGDLVGPEVSGVLTLETTPGEPFRIPRMRLEGEYRLENIRLVNDGAVLAYGEPREARINVTEILITRVSSRALTLDEIRSRGLVIDDSFEAINLTFAYGVAGRTFDFNMPMVYDTLGPSVKLVANPDLARLPNLDDSQKTVKPRFKVPKVVPFMIEVEKPEQVPIPAGGCDPREECRPELKLIRPMVGVILFPTEISLLHQFFSVVLQVENGAPEGDPAVLRDLFATIKVPSGIKLGETEPPTILGRPVPIKDPGPDGIRGTADDKNLLVAHASGDVEVLLEGVKHGTHVVEFDIKGVLEGLPTGPQPISGSAKGAIAVRDPRLTAHIAHPQVVRANVEYSLFITLANVGTSPVNLIELKLPSHAVSGVTLVDGHSRQIETLNPGESETVEFRVEAQRTGKVVSSSLRMGSSVDPSFEWSVAVGDDGSLSSDTLVLPNTSEALPKELSKQALALLGIGYSLAQAPPSFGSGLPRVGEEVIAERTYRFGQLGRHLDYGEPTIDVVSTLIVDWLGARDGDWDWDQLQRESQNGGKLAVAIADLLDQESSSPVDAFRRLASTTHYLGPQAVLAEGTLQVQVSSRTSGKEISGAGDDDERLRHLPFAELYDLEGGDLVVLGRPEEGGYSARLLAPVAGSGDLFLMVPDAAGTLREVRFTNISLQAGGSAYVDFQTSSDHFVLELDQDGDGIYESSRSPFQDTIASRPFQVLSAVQNVVVDEGGHVIDVLFSEEIDLASMVPRSAGRFVLPDNKSNGGLVRTEEDLVLGMLSGFDVIENPFEGLNNPRIVRVIFDNPASPFFDNLLTVSNLENVEGEPLGTQEVLVETRVDVPAIQLEGVIYGPDGLPLPGATVVLYERDLTGIEHLGLHCKEHPTASTTADENGRYHFGFVRYGACGPKFRVYAQDPQEGYFGNVRGKVRFAGETQELNLVMPGRGSVVGRVTYEDGSVPENLRVTVYNPQFKAGRRAHIGENGQYDVANMVVGTLTMSADDGHGHYAFGTFELPERGATAAKNLVIIRNDPQVRPPGRIQGTVKTVDGEPIFDAFVALYVEQERTAVVRTQLDGSFDFGQVPSGIAEIEVFTESSTYPGIGSAAQVFFEVHPDRTENIDIIVREDRGEIRGHVYQLGLDGSTTPVEGAVVWARDTDYHTITGADGSYVLTDVFVGSWKVHAILPDTGKEVTAAVTLTSTAEVVDRDLYFQPKLPDGGLIGRVLDYDNEPVANAAVHLAGGYLSVRWHHEAITDSDGRFVISGLGPGSYGVHAVHGSNGGVAWGKIRFPGDTEQVTVRFQKGTIKGRTVAPVGEDGTIDGVLSQLAYRKVEVVSQWGLVVVPPDYTYIETDPNGYFEIEGLVGPYEIKVFNAFHGNLQAEGQLDYHGQEVEHIFQFKANGDIRGVVFDHDGETPVVDAKVSLHGGNFDGYDVRTDEHGAFHFPLVPTGSYEIKVFHSEGVIYRRAEATVGMRYRGQQVNDVEVVLPIQGSLTGWVTDADGYPVPGAVITMQEGVYPWRKWVQNADEEGNYAFENVFGGGPVTLYAKAPSLGGLKARTRAEIFFEAQDVLTVLTLEPTGELEGRVVMPDGTPVFLASVELSRDYSFEDAATTEEDGMFYFDKLRMGWYRVLVYDKGTGRKGRSAWVELEEHNQVVTANVELESRGIVTGRFTDGDTGSALPGHLIRLSSRFLTYYATTDLDGNFDFGGIREGDFSLKASDSSKRRWTRRSGSIQYEDQEVVLDLTLAPLSDVTGRVHNPPGAPAGLADGINIRIEQSGRVVGAGFDNPFSFGGIIPRQSFKLIATQAGTLRQARRSSKISVIGQDRDYDLTLQAIGAVTVRVNDSFGQPVNGASVHVFNRHDYGQETFNGSTGSDHEITFGDLREGRVTATARNPINGLKGSTHGELTLDGENLILDVTLQNTGYVRGRVYLSDGVTPAVAALVALKRGSKWYLGETDELGLFDFQYVKMGAYTLVVQEADLGLGSIERFGDLSSNGEIDDWGNLVLDDEDPHVVSIEPASGTRDLPLNTQVVVTFSEPMNVARQGSAVKLRKISGSNVNFTSSWSADKTQLTMIPNSALKSATGYEVYISQNIYDLAGRDLEWRVRTNFHTADVLPPAVIRTLPRNNATQVPVDSDVRVTFSEPVELTSLSGTALQLTDLTTGAGLTTTFQLRPGDREVIVTPTTDFEPDHDIRLTIQNVADRAGNVMPNPVSITFWTPDESPPTAELTAPEAGATYTSGDAIEAWVTATDNRGMGSVTFSIGELTAKDTSSPFTATLWAPVVDQGQNVTLTAEAVDRFGNAVTLQRDVWVEPHVNGNAPTVTPDCWYDGDLIQPAVDIPIQFRAEDDERLESYTLWVNGEVVQRAPAVNTASVDKTITWMPPHDALPGTVFVVEVQARDYAGNVGSYTATMTVPTAYRTSDQVLNELVNGQDLVLGTGAYTLDKHLDLNSLTMMRGSELRTRVDGIDLNIVGELRLQCESKITAYANGYDGDVGGGVGGAPDWVQPSIRDAGGSHGGRGLTHNSGSAGEVYDSVYRPTLMGGGGPQNSSSQAGDGGGIIHLEVGGAVLLNGDIVARGERSSTRGGGGGGTVSIHAPSITGKHGLISTYGSDGDHHSELGYGGPAGGGRIALWVDDLAAIDVANQLFSRGGTNGAGAYAAPGTIYLRSSQSTYGDLVISNGYDGGDRRVADVPAELPELGSGAVLGATVDGADLWIAAADVFRPRWMGVWVTLLDGPSAELGTFEVIELTDGQIRLAGAAAVVGATSYRGLYRFDSLSVTNAQLELYDRVEVPTFEIDGPVAYPSDLLITDHVVLKGSGDITGPIQAEQLTIAAGAVLKPTNIPDFHMQVEGLLTIEAGAVIDVTGLGYWGGAFGQPGDAPANVDPSTGNAGGSHGGSGGVGTLVAGTAGEVYDSVYDPVLPGAGGGPSDEFHGSAGGGVLWIDAGSLQLDGTLKARGLRKPGQRGPGAGGTIRVSASSLTGTGTIDVQGGDGSWSNCCGDGGSGGGGRIALHVDDLTGFDPAGLIMFGAVRPNGTPKAAPGTAYLFDAQSVYGDLVIDGFHSSSSPVTRLPSIGHGVIGAVTADGDDLWIAPQDADRRYGVGVAGMWLRVNGVDYKVLEEQPDRRGLRIQGAAQTLVVGDRYVGIYKFDSVTLSGGARLVLDDGLEAQELLVSPDCSLTQVDLEPPSIVLGAPVVASSGDLVSLGATVTDNEALATVEITFNGQTEVLTDAPFTFGFRMPIVDQTAVLTLGIAALDEEGNFAAVEQDVTVHPSSDESPPTIAFGACPADGDWIEPGGTVALPYSVSDDQLIERVILKVDGVEFDAEVLELGSAEGELIFQVPATLGQTYSVTFEARDFGNNVASQTRTLSTPSIPVRSGDQILDASVDGSPLILGSGAFDAQGPLAPSSLLLLKGATLSTAQGQTLDLRVEDGEGPGPVDISCGSSIDVSAVGFVGGYSGIPGGSPAGLAGSLMNAGGSHGGRGWTGDLGGVPGAAYGSVYFPSLPGGGGAGADAARPGGAGGGAVRLIAGELVLEGDLLAGGSSSDSQADSSRRAAGAGAGGSIWIDVTSLRGAGRIDASGGRYLASTGSIGGSGAGGRVAVYADDLATFDRSRLTADGGYVVASDGSLERLAAAGTVLIHDAASTYGDLILSQAVEVVGSVGETVLVQLGSGTLDTVEAIQDSTDAWVGSSNGPFGLGVEGAWLRIAGTDYRIVSRGADGRVRLADAAGVLGAGAAYTGVYKFDSLADDGRATFQPQDAAEFGSAPVVDTPMVVGDLSEGSVLDLSAAFSGLFTAPGSYSATFDWGDGNVSSGLVSAPGGSLQVDGSHIYAGHGSYGVSVCLTDERGTRGCNGLSVVITNVAPVIELVGTPAAVELEVGQSLDLLWRFLDPGTGDVHSADIDWGDGIVQSLPSVAPTVFESQSHIYGGAGSLVATVCVDDGADRTCRGIAVEVTAGGGPTVTVDSLTEGAAQGQSVELGASFVSQPGGPYAASVDWGDGSAAEALAVTPVTGGGTLVGSHVYADAGTFSVTVCVNDSQGAGCGFGSAVVANEAPEVSVFEPFDYSTWHAADMPFGDLGSSSWTVTGSQVKQTHNSQPTFFIGDVPSVGARLRGSMIPTDDDVIGFVLGYNPGELTDPHGDYLVLAWRATGPWAGLRLVRIHGQRPKIGYLVEDDSLEVLAHAQNLGETPFVVGQAYDVQIEALPERLKIRVDGVLEFDLRGSDLVSLETGVFGFHAHAQQDAVFEDFGREAWIGEEGAPLTVSVSISDLGSIDSYSGWVSWGDGSALESVEIAEVDGLRIARASHVFVDQGTYSPRVCVDDGQAETCTDLAVEIWNGVPQPTLALPFEVAAGLGVDATLDFTDGGVLDAHSASMDWGDGSSEPLTLASTGPGSGSADANHVYATAGFYSVTACVVDNDGDQECVEAPVTVTGGGLALSVDSIASTEEGSVALLDGSLSGSAGEMSAVVDWGDGQVQTVVLGADPVALSVEHVYVEDGSYGVSVCVAGTGLGACAGTSALVTNDAPELRGYLGPFDYSDWHYMDVPIGSSGDSRWVETTDGVIQELSSRPSYFAGGVPSENVRIRGKFRVPSDNDWIGFVFGYDLNEQTRPDGDYLLLGWKRTTESDSNLGMRLARIQGVTSGLWRLVNSSTVSILGHGLTLGNERFDSGRTYEILYENVDGRTQIWIDDVLQFDLEQELPTGSFGFYSYSQPTEFWDFEVEALLAKQGRSADFRVDFSDAGLWDTHDGPGPIDPHYGGGRLTQLVVFQGYGVRSLGACVTDDEGDTGCIEQPITVLPGEVDPAAPVVASPSITGDFLEGSSLSLSTTFGSNDGDRAYTATVDWGDGTSSYAAVSGVLPILSVDASHTYADQGSYALTVCVQDDLGFQGCNSAIPVIANVPATVVLGSTPPAVEIFAEYLFDLDWSFTDPGLNDAHLASIDWGDGTVESLGPVIAGQSLLHSHVYQGAGSFTIQACIDDGIDSACVQVAAEVEILPIPEVTIDSLSSGISQGGFVDLAASWLSEDVGPFVATVDWGDGSAVETVPVSQVTGGGNLSASHVFADDGDFTVEVCIVDSLEFQGCATAWVTVANVAPTLEALGPYDFSDWHRADIAYGAAGASSWSVASATEVRQSGNNQPSFFVGNAWSSGMRIRGKLWTQGDNDWIGLVLGYDEGEVTAPQDDYLVLGWKDPGDSDVAAGMRLARVTGTGGNLWKLIDSQNVEILADAVTRGSSGYADSTEYEFLVESLPGQLRVWVNGVLQFDQRQGVDALGSGLFGFYAYAQEDVRFRNFAAESVLGREGETTRLTLNLSDPGVLDTYTGTVDWGDGAVGTLEARNLDGRRVVEAQHVYAEEGVFTAQVCVSDDALDSHCVEVPVEIWNAEPVVSVELPWQADGQGAVSGQALYVDGAGDTQTATVDWGDGSSESITLQDLGGGAGSGDLAYVYGAAGRYTVSVCVTDDEGASGCTSKAVTFSGGGLVLGAATANDADEGAPVDLQVDWAGATGDLQATVDWGDGAVETFSFVSTDTQLTAQHVYGDNGSFGIEICVGNAGQGDCASTTVVVGNLPPEVSGFSGPFDYGDWHTMDTQDGDWATGNWSQITGGVHQVGNSRPTFFVGNVPSDNVRIRGKMKMFSDDDWVGLAFGLQLNEQNMPDPDFMVLGWKDITQAPATRGLRLVRFRGGMINGGLWNMNDGSRREVVALAETLGASGYSNSATYEFVYEQVGNHFRLWVDDVLQFDLEGDFPRGSFGFFTNAHEKVQFTDWQVEALLAEEGQESSVRAIFTDPGSDDTHVSTGVLQLEHDFGRVEHPVSFPTEGLWTTDVCVTDDDAETGCLEQSVLVVPESP